MLWTAPELFDKPVYKPSAAADVYSFGILCSELITEMEAYAIHKNEHNMTDDGSCSCFFLTVMKQNESLTQFRITVETG